MAIAKFARNDDEKTTEVGTARRHTPVFQNELTCILPNVFQENYMTRTSPSIVSHRLEGFGIPTIQAGASDSVMIPGNPELDKHMRRAPPHPASADRGV
jgi:hypothetical protein